MNWLDYTVPGFEFTVTQLIVALIVVAVGIIIGRAARVSTKRVLASTFPEHASQLIQRIINYAIILVAVLAALSYLHVDFTGALLAGGVLGIIIGFATQSAVANLISGIFLQLEKSVSIGDPIRVVDADLDGVILEINAFSTIIRTFDGVNLRIPNEKLFTSKIINYSKHVARRVKVTVGIAFKEDTTHAIDTIKKTLDNHPLILAEPPPIIYVDALGESSVNLTTLAWTPSTTWFTTRTQIVEQIKNALDDAGIEIPFPQRVIRQAEP